MGRTRTALLPAHHQRPFDVGDRFLFPAVHEDVRLPAGRRQSAPQDRPTDLLRDRDDGAGLGRDAQPRADRHRGHLPRRPRIGSCDLSGAPRGSAEGSPRSDSRRGRAVLPLDDAAALRSDHRRAAPAFIPGSGQSVHAGIFPIAERAPGSGGRRDPLAAGQSGALGRRQGHRARLLQRLRELHAVGGDENGLDPHGHQGAGEAGRCAGFPAAMGGPGGGPGASGSRVPQSRAIRLSLSRGSPSIRDVVRRQRAADR